MISTFPAAEEGKPSTDNVPTAPDTVVLVHGIQSWGEVADCALRWAVGHTKTSTTAWAHGRSALTSADGMVGFCALRDTSAGFRSSLLQ